MPNRTQLRALLVLYRLARDDRPAELHALAAALGLRCAPTDGLLRELERMGLADADRVRLTLSGLALAVALPASFARRPRRAAVEGRKAA